VVTWSQRDNNNYEESALLSTLNYYADHAQHFLDNFYLKSKRSVQKPALGGPAAWVLPADPAETNRQLQLIEVLKRQHVEVSRLGETRTQLVPAAKRGEAPVKETLPAGSFVVRMDQPYSRVADALLDRQYWAPDDPQKHPYDDTGWSFPQLFNVKAVRVVDPSILSAPMTPLGDPAELAGKLSGSGDVVAVDNTGQSSLLSLVYRLKGAKVAVAEAGFEAEGRRYAAGSLLITGAEEGRLADALKALALDGERLHAQPKVATHPAAAPRIAIMHTWLATQSEGWWRYAFDEAGIPYAYISTQTAAADPDLRAKYDVIVFAPVGGASPRDIVDGIPRYGNAMPWEKTSLTPNLGRLDSTPDTRPGLGGEGVDHLKSFVAHGGLLITCEDTAQFAIDYGLAPGVSVAPKGEARVVGSVLGAVFVGPKSPVAYGFGKEVAVMSADGLAFNVSETVGRRGGRVLMDPYAQRPTGRGTVEDSDVVQGREPSEAEPLPKPKPWEAMPLNEDQMRNNPSVIPEALRPEVILRFTDAKDLLRSGLLDKPGSIAEHAIVVDARLGTGNVLLFANLPIYRGETVGTYPLVFNAIMNFEHLASPAPAASSPSA
jgi:hypothetical protein